jgi:hypothetical protein
MTQEADADESVGVPGRTLVANERAKLTAAYLNGVAIGLLLIGAFAPVFSFMFAAQASRPSLTLLGVAILVCQLGSGCLHWIARRVLGGLKP